MVNRAFEHLGTIHGQSPSQWTCGAAQRLGTLLQVRGRPIHRRYLGYFAAVGPDLENRCTRVTKRNDLIQQNRQ